MAARDVVHKGWWVANTTADIGDGGGMGEEDGGGSKADGSIEENKERDEG